MSLVVMEVLPSVPNPMYMDPVEMVTPVTLDIYDLVELGVRLAQLELDNEPLHPLNMAGISTL